jgi:hypothetical protein
MPSKWASWAELGLMYLMYPHTAGLIVHVCGILVGLAYLRRRTILRTLGLENMLSSGGGASPNTANTGGSGYRWHRANSGGAGTIGGREPRRTGLGLKITEARLGPSSVDGPTPTPLTSSPARG